VFLSYTRRQYFIPFIVFSNYATKVQTLEGLVVLPTFEGLFKPLNLL